MANSHELRSCPTRTDGAASLVAHKVSLGQCQDRQRNRYHKCFTCAFNNARVALYGLPVEADAAGVAAEAPAAAEPVAAPEPVEHPEPLVPAALG